MTPAGQKQFEENAARYMLPYRNSPSVVMWATNPNRYGWGGEDEDPRYLGTTRGVVGQNTREDRIVAPRWCATALDKLDPTRPCFNYSGNFGDVWTSNCYLDFTPLQDREEWLSQWAKSGDMPYMAVEFGTPWSASLNRGRWGQSSNTEPWMTEFCAIYLGPEAYSLEPDTYRGLITKTFQGGQTYGNTWGQQPLLVYAAPFQQLEVLFNRNTYRSWRMYGVSGGMVP
jgi:beta-galactosidase